MLYCKTVGSKSVIFISFKSVVSHAISHEISVVAIYSASAMDLVTIDCFLNFQEIGEFPRKIQKLEGDFLLTGQLPQSLSR